MLFGNYVRTLACIVCCSAVVIASEQALAKKCEGPLSDSMNEVKKHHRSISRAIANGQDIGEHVTGLVHALRESKKHLPSSFALLEEDERTEKKRQYTQSLDALIALTNTLPQSADQQSVMDEIDDMRKKGHRAMKRCK